MNKKVLQQAAQIQRKRRNRKTWTRIVTGLSAIVVFAITYSLILPAITMEAKLICGRTEHLHSEACYETTVTEASSAELICRPEAHIHTEDCMGTEGTPCCGTAELLIHAHNEFCYHNGQLICPLDEQTGHLHTDACYTAEAVLICGLDGTEGHTHTEECAEIRSVLTCARVQTAVHTHTEACTDGTGALICGILSACEHTHSQDCLSVTVNTEETKTLVCGIEEHVHTEKCKEYPTRTDTIPDSETFCGHPAHSHGMTCHTLICGVTEEGHEHTEGCYGADISCEIAEHIHTLICKSDPTADTEIQADWERSVSGVMLVGNAPEDLLSIALSQLGIAESERNFTVAEDGVTKLGYNRYGAWFGAPYTPWNTLFLSFCARYAGVDTIPVTTDPEDVIAALKADENALFHGAGSYSPLPGDLIFFDTDGDGYADRVGIVEVCSVPNLTMKIIEGDAAGQVARVTYNIPADGVLGYGQLAPAKPVTEEPTEPEPGDGPVTDPVTNQSGTLMHHAPNYSGYQYSSHTVDGATALIYALIPYADYSEGWQPNTLQWTAGGGANFVAAYSADRSVAGGGSGSVYTTEEIGSSDYAHCAAVLSGIAQHAYPFIPADEMLRQLTDAYLAGELAADPSCCTESELIAACQWAIWDAVGLNEPGQTAAGSLFPSENDSAIAPLTDPGHTDDAAVQAHVKAIRDWLMSRTLPEELTVSNHWTQVTRRADGAYDMTVTLLLHRPLENKEVLLADLIAGSKKDRFVISGAGLRECTLSLSDLTAEEALSAAVQLEVHLEHMEVFIYDSEDRQDLIGGQRGETVYTHSMQVRPSTVSVSVTMDWADDEVAVEAVSVQLFADGRQYGEPATLCADNGWSFTWEPLLKDSANGVPIVYTVMETPIPGYLSSVTQEETGNSDLRFRITGTRTEEHTSVSVTTEWTGRDDGSYPDRAEVYLLQNGVPYGTSVILTAENGWTYLWENLPLRQDGTEFTYTVEAVRIAGYTVSVETAADESGNLSFLLRSTWSPEYLSLVLAAADANNLTHLLPGARFQLYRLDTGRTEASVPIPYTDVSGIPMDTVIIGAEGSSPIRQLLAGEVYYLVEMLAPTGYTAPDEAIAFTVETDENGQTVITVLSGASRAAVSGNDTLLVKNAPAYKLPATGGPGTHLYTLGGLLLVVAAAAILLYSRISRRKEDFPSS